MAEEIESLVVRVGLDGTGFQNGVSDINRQMRVVKTEFEAAASQVGGFGNSVDGLKIKQESLSKQIDLQQQKVVSLRGAFEQSIEQKGRDAKATQELEIKLNKAKTALGNMGNDLKQTSTQIEKMSAESEQLGTGFDQAGKSASGFGQILKGSLLVGVAAVGVAFASFFSMANEMQQSMGKLQAQTGLSGESLDTLGGIAREVFKEGFGDSISSVTADISVLRRNLGSMYEDEMGAVLEGALTIGETFGASVDETSKVVKTLTGNFKNLSKEQALDLITVGFQKGGDYAGDLLDTLNEYAPQFATMGMSAQDMLGTLISGAEAGAFNMDKVADAVKEFNIRAQDGSKTTSTGFAAIGLDANKMGADIAAGGDKAKTAFMATVAALKSMQDPLKQEQAGVALFGTQWEDVKDKVILSMQDASKAVEGFEGATSRAGQSLHQDLGSKFEQIRRSIVTSFASTDNPLMNQLSGMSDWVLGHMPEIQNGIKTAMQVISTAFTAIGDAVSFVSAHMDVVLPLLGMIGAAIAADKIMGGVKALQEAGGAIKLIGTALKATFLANPWALAIGAVVAVGVAIYTHWDEIKAFLSNTWQAITATAMAVWEGIKGFFVSTWDVITTTTMAVWNGITGLFGAAWDSIKGIFLAAFAVIEPAVTAWFTGISAYFSAVWDTIKTLFSTAWETIKVIFATAFLVVYDIVTGRWGEIGGVLAAGWNKIKELFGGALDHVKGVWRDAWAVISYSASVVWGTIKGIFIGAWEGLKSIVSSGWQAITTFISNGWQAFKDFFANGWNTLKTGAANGMSNAGSAIQSAWNAIGEWFATLPDRLGEWGLNVVQGFVNGITGAADWAIGKIKEFFGDVLGWARKILGIASPSKVTKLYGAWFAEGFALGIAENKDKAVAQADIMARAVSDAVSKTLGDINLDLQISQSEFDVFSKQVGTTATAATEKLKAKMELLNIQMSASEDRLSVLWSAYGDMAAAKGENAEETRKLYLEILKEQSAQADLKKQIDETNDTITAHGDRVLAMQKRVADATDEYKKKESAAYDEYQKKVSDTNKKLADEEQKLTDQYKRSLDDRTRALTNFAGLFDEVKPKDVSGTGLLENLRGQVDAFEGWQGNITALAKRGIDGGLLEELRAMGPKAGAEIGALNNLTDGQLKEYVNLWKRKQQDARQQAQTELQGMKQDTQRKIEEIRKQTAEQLEHYKQEWMIKNRELRAELDASYTAIIGDATQFGTDWVQSIQDAINAKKDSLSETFGSLREEIETAMRGITGAIGGFAVNPFGMIGGVLSAGLGNIPGLAKGGTVIRQGLTLVGENGPEVLNLPRGSSVIPLDRDLGGGATTVQLIIQGPIYGVDDLERQVTGILQDKAVPILRGQLQQTRRSMGRG